MNHAIEQFADGSAAFFSARIPAWHTLGTVTPGCLTAADALRVAHLDWTVRKSDTPIQAPVLTENGVTTLTLEDKFLTWRDHPITRDAEALGVVGTVYQPFQNVEAMEFLTAVADESGAVFETAGGLDGGRKVFVTMRMPETMLIGGEDPVDLYLIAYNSHDGTSAFGAAVTPVRVVCQNTLTAGIAAAQSRVSFRHTTSIAGRVQQAREALALSFRVAQAFQAEADRLIATPMSGGEYREFVKALVPVTPKMTARMAANAERKAAELLALWSAPTQENITGTRWAAYNTVTEWADWSRPVRGGDDASSARARRTMLDLLDFQSTTVKQDALRLLLAGV